MGAGNKYDKAEAFAHDATMMAVSLIFLWGTASLIKNCTALFKSASLNLIGRTSRLTASEVTQTYKGARLVTGLDDFAEYAKGFLDEDALLYAREVLGNDADDTARLKKIAQLVEDGSKKIGGKLSREEVETALNVLWDNGETESALTAIEGIRKRIFRETTPSDADLIQGLKKKYNAGKTKNAACAKGNINGDMIDLECISGGFKHEDYFNKGNFEPPMPEEYYYKGPKSDFVHHTEQKIVEYLRMKYQGDQNVSGQIEIISEREYCENCRVLVDLFEKEFPNIKVIRVEVNK